MSDTFDNSSLIRSLHDCYNNVSEKVKVGDDVDINKIFFDAMFQNKIIGLSLIPFIVGYYLRDTVFVKSLSEVTSDLPKFTTSLVNAHIESDTISDVSKMCDNNIVTKPFVNRFTDDKKMCHLVTL